MNILMMTLLYPQDQMNEVTANAKDKLQNQINNYQKAFIEGIRENLLHGEKLDILNCLPVGIFPFQYRKLILKSGIHDDGMVRQLGCINIPWLKQKWRAFAAANAIKEWAKESSDNRTVLIYTQYLPYMQAVCKAKKRIPDLKAAVIITDLPNEMGLSTGRKGFMKRIETSIGKKSLSLLRKMDGFIPLTIPMTTALQIQDKPFEVIEGLIVSNQPFPASQVSEKPVFLYTGTLERELGVQEMLNAFREMPEYELWICGHGTMKTEVESFAESCHNIRFFGFVTQQEALAMQANATALLNPRQPNGLFTRYSFPSKTLEYMRSGKPVLCCKLDGIPADYDPYLCYMDTGANGIVQAVQKLMKLTAEDRERRGLCARDYVLQHKNPKTQCEKLLSLLRRMR